MSDKTHEQQTVWDHYAAAAMNALVSFGCENLATPDVFIKSACGEAAMIADAMLAERSKRSPIPPLPPEPDAFEAWFKKRFPVGTVTGKDKFREAWEAGKAAGK